MKRDYTLVEKPFTKRGRKVGEEEGVWCGEFSLVGFGGRYGRGEIEDSFVLEVDAHEPVSNCHHCLRVHGLPSRTTSKGDYR